MKISTAYLSDQGGRNKNDDTVRIEQMDKRICVFVGDGLGGYDGGRIASQAASETVMDFQKDHSLLKEENMQKAASLAHEAVKEAQKNHHGLMKTTMTLLSVEEGKARWMHVGDTRIYYFRSGLLQSQTMDHSVSQVAVLMGEIRQEEIRFHEDRNRVLRALGSDNAKPDISPVVDVSIGNSAFLLCTDGFWEYVYENEMEQLLREARSPQEWLEKMEKLLKKRVQGDNDNFSAAAVFCE